MEREHIDDGKAWCYLHPEELMIGVCALCLHQRLLILAKKRQQQQQRRQHDNHNSSSSSSISLHNVFGFGSLLDRLHIVRKRKSDDTTTASISQQESFISINLEDNSIKSSSSSWGNKKAIVPKNDSQRRSMTKSSVVEHTKPRSSNPRWPNRIGNWFQLIAWKKKRPTTTTTTTSSANKVVNANSRVGSKLKKVKVFKHAYIHTLQTQRKR